MSGFENFMEFQHENEGMEISSMSVASPFQLASSDWDPLVSLSQVQNFGGSPMVSYSEFANSSYPLILENQGMSSTSHLVQHIYYNSNLEDMVPKFPSYGSSRFLEMVDVAYTGHEPNYNPSNEVGIENGQINNEHPQGPEEVEPGSAPSENSRERVLDYNFESSLNKDVEVDAMKYSSEKNDTNGVKELDENKQSSGANLHDKQPAKQKKDNSHNGEAHKEGFVRVTAGRGQATNSHSLAERVRREKISERMRFLQELVPGCSKITGKAVMLDEIINYVQSLQQQVEFLSMKLAAVNPELNFEAVEGILSKDIPQSRIGHRHVDGDAPRINCSHPFPGGNFQDTLPAMITTSTQVPPLSPTILDHELQSLYGMSYDSRAAFGNLAPNDKKRVVMRGIHI